MGEKMPIFGMSVNYKSTVRIFEVLPNDDVVFKKNFHDHDFRRPRKECPGVMRFMTQKLWAFECSVES